MYAAMTQGHVLNGRPAGDAPFTGRDAELESVVAAMSAPPALILVEGDGGAGKTRLVAEALGGAARNRRLLYATCPHVDTPPRLGPLLDALSQISVRRPVVLRPDMPATGDPPAPGADLDHRAIRDLLADPPTVCVLEDVEWCDGATVDALRTLCAHFPPALVLVLTYSRASIAERSALPALAARCSPDVGVTRVALGPLTSDDIEVLLATRLPPGAAAPGLAAGLLELTGGNPLALHEVLRQLDLRVGTDPTSVHQLGAGSNGFALTASYIDELPVPAALRDRELEALERVSPDARRFVEVAAVIAEPARFEDVAAVGRLTEPRALAALRAATRVGLLRERPDGTCTLGSPLAVRAVYTSIPVAERRILHRRVATRLAAARTPSARLLRHLREAGATDEWIVSAEAVAGVAMGECRFADAARLLLDIATEPAVTPVVRRRVAVDLAHAVAPAGILKRDAIAVLRRCLDERPPRSARALLRHKVGDLLISVGETSEGRAELARAAIDTGASSSLRVHGLATLSDPWGPGADLTENMRWLGEAMAELTPETPIDARISVLSMRCTLLLCTGDRGAWAAVRDIPWHETSGAARRDLMWAASALIDPCYHLGRYDRARGFLDDTVRRARELGNDELLALLDGSAMALDWATGAWIGLAPRVRAYADHHATRRPGPAARARRAAGLIAAARGEREVAEADLRRALDEAVAAGTVPGIAAASAGLARLRLAVGDGSGACAEAVRGLAPMREKGIWAWAGEIAPPAVEALLGCGRRAEADDLVAGLDAGLRGRDAPLARAALAACRALGSEDASTPLVAAQQYERAARAYASMPRPYEEALMTARQGAALLTAGDASGAAHLYDAYRTLRALEATADLARLRRTLRRFSLAAPTEGRRGRLGYGANLSPRQKEIAELAASGLTNAQISSRLALSARTVENHLALAMSKLGVRSRTVLAREWNTAPNATSH